MTHGVCLLVVSSWMSAAPATAPEPIVLENEQITLRFDAFTGAWTHLVDRRSGENLVTAPAPSLPGSLVLPTFDRAALDAALRDRAALSLEGTWRFAPEPAQAEPDALAAPEFDDRKWTSTPIPSRLDEGDHRLKDQVGTFWYRTSFQAPAAWRGRDLAVLIGAVDDFDTTYFNGRQIGATNASTPHHWEVPRGYRIPAERVRYGELNTLAIRVFNGAFEGGIIGPVAIGPAEALPKLDVPMTLEAHQRTTDGRGLTLVIRSGPFRVHAAYRLHATAGLIARQFTVENAGAQREVIRWAACELPTMMPGPATAIITPDSLPVGDQPADSLGPDRAVHPTSQDGLVYLWSPQARRATGSWYYSESEYAPVAISSQGQGVRIVHQVGVQAPLEPGQRLTLGQQFVWTTAGSRDDVLRSVRPVFEQVNLRPPSGGLEGLRECVLYCGHPGGMPEKGFREYGGFNALQAYLPTLKKMGIDLLWLLPIFEHGDGKKWNLYSPFDHFQISPLYGTPAELKQLSASARDAGIRLMLDLVPHGPPDHTPLGKAHPEWVCLDEAGKPTYVWSQLAFDNAHPGWQDYMRRAAEHNAREYGAVGARVDVAAGSPPNWNPKADYRPSHSTLGGGLGMDRAIREGFRRVHPGVVLLPEEYTGVRTFYRDADLTYDAQLFFLMVELQESRATPEEWARKLQQFLHDQSLTLPPGALKMRWTANHDTVSWTFQKKRTRDAYGFERARALLSLCCLIDGVPMIYQGEEDPALYGGKGGSIVDYLSTIIACRKRLPALSRGTADYQSVKATGGVFACLRTDGANRAIVLVSFSNEPINSQISMESSLMICERLTDELSGEQVALTGVPMADHQVRVLTAQD